MQGATSGSGALENRFGQGIARLHAANSAARRVGLHGISWEGCNVSRPVGREYGTRLAPLSTRRHRRFVAVDSPPLFFARG